MLGRKCFNIHQSRDGNLSLGTATTMKLQHDAHSLPQSIFNWAMQRGRISTEWTERASVGNPSSDSFSRPAAGMSPDPLGGGAVQSR